MFESQVLKRILINNKVEAKQLYKIILNLLLLKNETFSQMFLQGTRENLSTYYLSLQKDYLTFLSQYFIKGGNKNKVENMFQKIFFKVKKRKNQSKRWAKKTWRSFLKCKYNAMYYIRLKIRKRRRKVKYRVTYLESYRWLKKSALPLAKTIKESKLRTFSDAFNKEFLLLRSGKSAITVKRNEYHKLAYIRAPYSWKKERKLKQKRQKGPTWRFFKVWNRKVRKRKWALWLKKSVGVSSPFKPKKALLKKRFNKWVRQFLLNQDIFQQMRQNSKLKKTQVYSNLKLDKKLEITKGINLSAISPKSLVLFSLKRMSHSNKIFKNGDFFFAKVRLSLKDNKEYNNALIKLPVFSGLTWSLGKKTPVGKSADLKLISTPKSKTNLIFSKNSMKREKFIKNYLLPRKLGVKLDLSKPFPLVNKRSFFYFFKTKRIQNKRGASKVKKTIHPFETKSLFIKNIFVKKLKRLNNFNYNNFKGSKNLDLCSFIVNSTEIKNTEIDLITLKNILKGKSSTKLKNMANAGKLLKIKSTYDHSFKSLTFFSVILVWKFVESRLLKNLTLNEYKKIEKDSRRKKKYQFIKKMFYYIKMLYRDVYKV